MKNMKRGLVALLALLALSAIGAGSSSAAATTTAAKWWTKGDVPGNNSQTVWTDNEAC